MGNSISNNIQVSVIIPVYNTEKYLSRCLDSVINQTLKDIEIICVNDCSTDGSLEILHSYAQKDKRIKLIDLPQNVGAGRARNIGIDEAKGEYIGFIDSDDFIDTNFYEKLYDKVKDTRAEVVKGNIKTYDNELKCSKTENWLDLNYLIKRNKAYFCFTYTTGIYKTKFIRKYHIHFLENFIHFEDPYFTIMAGLFYKNLKIVDNSYYYYCNNKNSMSRNPTQQHAICQVEGTKLILKLLEKNKPEKEHYIIIIRYLIQQLVCWCNRTDCSDAITRISSNGLEYVLKNCNHLADVLFLYFNLKKESVKKALFYQLRNRITENQNA